MTPGQSDFRACHGATTATVRTSQIPPRDKAIRLVTISVGGNDMNFEDVMRHCAKPTGTTNGVVEDEQDESFHPNEDGHEAIAKRLRQVGKRWFK